MTLEQILLSALCKFASSRTMRYEIADKPKETDGKEQQNSQQEKPVETKPIDATSCAKKEFQSKVVSVVSTIKTLAAAEGKIVVVNDSAYEISSYVVPVFAQGIIDAGHIYFNDYAANVADEIYCVEVTDLNDVLTPMEFNLFWTTFNAAQPPEYSFTLSPAVKAAYHTLSEIEIAKMGNGEFGLIGGSVVPGQVCQLLDITIETRSGLKSVPKYTDKELIEWLMQ